MANLREGAVITKVGATRPLVWHELGFLKIQPVSPDVVMKVCYIPTDVMVSPILKGQGLISKPSVLWEEQSAQ